MNCSTCETTLSLSDNRGTESYPLCHSCLDSLDANEKLQLFPRWNPTYERSIWKKISNAFIKPSCDIPDDIQTFVEERMGFLLKSLGEDTFLNNKQMTPDGLLFKQLPTDPERMVHQLFERIARRLGVDSHYIELRIMEDEDHEVNSNITGMRERKGAAGTWQGSNYSSHRIITIYTNELSNLDKITATIVHELGHEILIGGGIQRGNEDNHEFTTDLLSIFNGFGIFTLNSVLIFRGWQSGLQVGWSSARTGYMDEPMCAYALACFALMRGELFPQWYTYLNTNGKNYFRKYYLYLLQKKNRQVNPLRELRERFIIRKGKKIVTEILNNYQESDL